MTFSAGLSWAGGASLVGTWLKDGGVFAELRSDGTGRIDQDQVSWKADGKRLLISYGDGGTELFSYRLDGPLLRVTVDGEVMTLKRADGVKTEKAKPGKKTEKAAASKDRLSELLLSSAWCSFTYNERTGASHQSRVVFRGDGTWSSGARGETYSSGKYGTVSGQSDSGDGGLWRAQGGRLLLSQGAGPLEDAGLGVKLNSNGYPILTAGGREYSQCR